MRLVVGRRLRILSFDLENRPLSFLGSDYTTDDITAIAAAWTDNPDGVQVWTQKKDDRSRARMLRSFVRLYDQADIVTGHFILSHDLPIISGALIEEGLPPLGPKMVSDTKVHLIGFKGISKSQKNLAMTLGISVPKVDMSDPEWREANRLTPRGVALSVMRVSGDVVQHIELRKALVERGLLRPPSRWAGTVNVRRYVP